VTKYTVFIALVAAFILAGSAGGSEWSRSTRGCPRLSQAAGLPLRPGGSPLRTDVDGDSRRDAAAIHYSLQAPVDCGFVLVVKTASRVVAVRVPEPYTMPVNRWPYPEPYLAAAVRLNAHRSQIVVALWHGASITNVGLYGLVGGQLARLRFHPRTSGDQLPLFGTVGTGSTYARCARGGPLIVASIWPKVSGGKRWSVRRTQYRLARGVLSLTRARTVTGSERRIDALLRRWKMGGLPFNGCVVARGRRL